MQKSLEFLSLPMWQSMGLFRTSRAVFGTYVPNCHTSHVEKDAGSRLLLPCTRITQNPWGCDKMAETIDHTRERNLLVREACSVRGDVFPNICFLLLAPS